jgi:hypothetical protein
MQDHANGQMFEYYKQSSTTEDAELRSSIKDAAYENENEYRI